MMGDGLCHHSDAFLSCSFCIFTNACGTLESMELMMIILFSLIGFGLLCLLYGFFIEPLWIKRRTIEIRFPQACKEIPFANKHIVFFSDIHTGASTTKRQLNRKIRAIMESHPDAIIFGGDLVEERTPIGDEAFREMVRESLNSLQAPLGKWAILGNHDVEAPRYHTWSTAILEETGFTLLDNEGLVLEGLPIWGFANTLHGHPLIHRDAFDNLMKEAGSCQWLTDSGNRPFTLYLVHESDWFPKRKPVQGPGLILTGHSHHGQVTFFGLPLIRPAMGVDHWKGFYNLGDQLTQVVSAGLGTVHIHARFFARPDIVTITFKRNPRSDVTTFEVIEK